MINWILRFTTYLFSFMKKQQTLFPEIEKKSLIIIGNGFDLAHGIESSYWNFKCWLGSRNNQRIIDLMDVFFSHVTDVWSNAEQALGEYDEEEILSYCRPDEEFDYDHSLSSSARIEDSPDSIFLPVLEEFKSAFYEWVISIDIDDVESIYTFSPQYLFLTFNYTDTLESIYGINEGQIAHIHGSRLASYDFVIGHSNRRNPKDVWSKEGLTFELQAHENIVTWMNELVKSYADNIQCHRAFFDNLNGIKNILTYGHSMAEVDWPYFEEIIRIVGPDIPWIVSYFSDNDLVNAEKFKVRFQITNLLIIRR